MIRNLFSNLTLSLVFVCATSAATNQARVSLHCLSLRFQPATAELLGQTYTLEFTTANEQDPANGELTPYFTDSSTHACLYKLYTPDSPDEPTSGELYLNIPDFVDANANGLNDFFEVSQAVSSTRTSGTTVDVLGQSALQTTWARAASSSKGTCILNLENYGLVFTHTFELLEYDGQLNYTVTSTNVAGFVDLAQTNATTNTLNGPLAFTVVNTNRVDLKAGSWTNAAKETLTYNQSENYVRNGNQYSGFLDFADFDLLTSAVDYEQWFVLITDPNDADSNGIPDLSDTAPTRPPSLSLRQDTNGLWLSVSGDVGRAYEVEQTVTLIQPQWTNVAAITLTNDPQVMKLSLPAEATQFWRARAR
jgi:hypothetical protein